MKEKEMMKEKEETKKEEVKEKEEMKKEEVKEETLDEENTCGICFDSVDIQGKLNNCSHNFCNHNLLK